LDEDIRKLVQIIEDAPEHFDSMLGAIATFDTSNYQDKTTYVPPSYGSMSMELIQ